MTTIPDPVRDRAAARVEIQEYFRAEDRVGSLAQPGVLLWGVKDRSHRNSNRAGLLDRVPAAEVRLIENTGHHLEHENPARVCEEIRRLVATLPARSSQG